MLINLKTTQQHGGDKNLDYDLDQMIVSNQRNTIINDSLSDGLSSLKHMTQDDIKYTLSRHAKKIDSQFPIILTPIVK